jgi:hypothetical protein
MLARKQGSQIRKILAISGEKRWIRPAPILENRSVSTESDQFGLQIFWGNFSYAIKKFNNHVYDIDDSMAYRTHMFHLQ